MIWNYRLSNVVDRDSPGRNSDGTASTTFSDLASGNKKGASHPSDEMKLTLGKMSLAALTSGVADSAWDSR